MARKGFPMGIPRSGKNVFLSASGKRLFSAEKANKPFRELTNCFATNVLNAKRPG